MLLSLTLGLCRDVAVDLITTTAINAAAGAVRGSVIPGAGTAAGAISGAVGGVVIGAIKVSRSQKYLKTGKQIIKLNKEIIKKNKQKRLLNNKVKETPVPSAKKANEIGGKEVKTDVSKEIQELSLEEKINRYLGGNNTSGNIDLVKYNKYKNQGKLGTDVQIQYQNWDKILESGRYKSTGIYNGGMSPLNNVY